VRETREAGGGVTPWCLLFVSSCIQKVGVGVCWPAADGMTASDPEAGVGRTVQVNLARHTCKFQGCPVQARRDAKGRRLFCKLHSNAASQHSL